MDGSGINNANIGSGGIQLMKGGIQTIAPTPAVHENKPVNAALIRLESKESPAVQIMPGIKIQDGKTGGDLGLKSGAVLPEFEKGVVDHRGPVAKKSLDAANQSVRTGQAGGGGEESLRLALNKIFDAAHVSMGRPMANVPGAMLKTEEKVKNLVAIANAAPSRSAPGLYASAIKTAEDSFPARVAARVKGAVLHYAAKKAALALPDLANQAYQAAAVADAKEVGEAFKALDQWEKLLRAPGRPLLANSKPLKTDIERVLGEGTKAAASGAKASAPRIWFAQSGPSFIAVLPSASVALVPLDLFDALALNDALSAWPFGQQAYLAFQARPTMANGFNLVYQVNRQAGGSAALSAYEAASFVSKSLLARVWRAIRDFLLGLLGRGPALAISRGFSVEASPEVLARIESGARRETVSLGGAHLRVAKMEAASAPAWREALSALALLSAQRAYARALLSRETPLDVKSARALIGLASAMAAQHGKLSGEESAAAVVRGLARRVEKTIAEEGLSQESPLTPALARLMAEPEGGSLGTWISRMQESGEELAMAAAGRAPANLLLTRGSLDGERRWLLADLGGDAPVRDGRIADAGLRAAARILADAQADPQGSFIVMDRQVLGRWGREGRYAKVYANMAPTAQGGAVRVFYEDASGISRAADILSALGFAVETRGLSLSATLESGTAELGISGLEETLSRAVHLLQSGRDPGPAARREEARREAASGVAKLAADLRSRRASAEAMAGVVESLASADLRFVTIGRVEGFLAASGRLALDDGRTLAFYVLKEPESGFPAMARVELESQGRPAKVLSAAELRALLRPR